MVHDTLSMFTFSLRTSGMRLDNFSVKGGGEVPDPCTPGRSAAISEAAATTEILLKPMG